jgi:hypothetical protein
MRLTENEWWPVYSPKADDEYGSGTSSLTYEQWVDTVLIENLFHAHQDVLEAVYETDVTKLRLQLVI